MGFEWGSLSSSFWGGFVAPESSLRDLDLSFAGVFVDISTNRSRKGIQPKSSLGSLREGASRGIFMYVYMSVCIYPPLCMYVCMYIYIYI